MVIIAAFTVAGECKRSYAESGFCSLGCTESAGSTWFELEGGPPCYCENDTEAPSSSIVYTWALKWLAYPKFGL